MPAWDSVVSLVLSGSSLILLVLVIAKYRESRPMKLSLFSLLFVSSVFRIARALMTGSEPSWVDGLAIVFFGYAAAAEAISLLREKRKGR